MAKRTVEKEIVSVDEIPADVIGAVVLADLAQIEADAATHPDSFARDRIIKAVTRLRDIAQGNVSADLVVQNELASPEPLPFPANHAINSEAGRLFCESSAWPAYSF